MANFRLNSTTVIPFPYSKNIRNFLLFSRISYFSHRMNITNATSKISTHDFRINGEWHVYGTSAEWGITYLDPEKQRGYAHVIFRLHLKRRYKFYIMNIVMPCVMLSVLIMISFCLPPDAGEKISLGISVLLAFTVFLLMIAESIPKTSSAIPLIGSLCCCCCCRCCCARCCCRLLTATRSQSN